MAKTSKTKLRNQMPPPVNHKADIEQAAAQAVKVISDASLTAAKGVAQAAADAAKVVAEAAAVSVKVLSIKNADDHDLLIELKTRMEGLKTDIKDLKDGTGVQLLDHEARIKKVETKTGNYAITIALYSIAVLAMIALIATHMFAK